MATGSAGGVLITQSDYVGTELELFAAARNWKRYWSDVIAPFVGGRVLDVGAGLGATADVFSTRATIEAWTCLEPDARFAGRLARRIASGGLPARTQARQGTVRDLDPAERFETILYIDVLEHIRDDHGELAVAAARLATGGHLVVLSPAHPCLYSPFDAAIGHERRYTRATLREAAPESLRRVRLDYLDAIGFCASLGNRLVLRSAMPNAAQIAAWDRLMVPLSRRLDPWLGFRAGKSVLGIWTR
ncbi:methyltransferase type 12 [Methylobacterium sp. Leaf104]|uniref:class I SAM-dependent methyltransferase n=1 Tax=Methylobacterium TaxID=407 RepID=UPI0006FE3704|nr:MULTISPECIES: methyltransferase domain-containing protein [Methylobacterium]KQP40299.1 methyltransferase type 12 [Methylobacterium sp. Leaf104]MCI9882664.1 methyltransferase domain-containing protein [Methylobacterium goesingense]